MKLLESSIDNKYNNGNNVSNIQRRLYPLDEDVDSLCKLAGIDVEYDPGADMIAYKCVQDKYFINLFKKEGQRIELMLSPGRRSSKSSMLKPYFVVFDSEGKEVECTWTHPSVESCKKLYKELEKRRGAVERRRVSLKKQFIQSPTSIEQDKIHKRNLETTKAYSDALLYYKSSLGDPQVDDVSPDESKIIYWRISPRDLKLCAKNVFKISLAEKPYLAWVVRCFLSSNLPPRWARENLGNEGGEERGKFLENCKLSLEDLLEFQTEKKKSMIEEECFSYVVPNEDEENILYFQKHPAIEYFECLLVEIEEEYNLLLETKQEEEFYDDYDKDGLYDEEEYIKRNQFWDFKTKSMFSFDFATNELVQIERGNGLSIPPCFDVNTKEPINEIEAQQRIEDALIVENEKIDPTEIDKEFIIKPLTLEELQQMLEQNEKQTMWQTLIERVHPDELDSFLSFIKVKNNGKDTEYLPEIIKALLSPLHHGWYRRRDPDGYLHYAHSCGLEVTGIYNMIANPTSSNSIFLPQWLLKANQLGESISLKTLQASHLHPEADSCRLFIQKAKIKLERDQVKSRIRDRQEKYEQQRKLKLQQLYGIDNPTSGNGLNSSESEHPLKAAFKYYVGLYGDPLDPQVIRSHCTTCHRSPQDVVDMAKYLLIQNDETHLYWIPHLRLASDIPPGWIFDENLKYYLYPAKEFKYYFHPADAYFLNVVAEARERKDSLQMDPKIDFLEMKDQNGKQYFYNFQTKETRMSPPNLRAGSRHSTCLVNKSFKTQKREETFASIKEKEDDKIDLDNTQELSGWGNNNGNVVIESSIISKETKNKKKIDLETKGVLMTPKGSIVPPTPKRLSVGLVADDDKEEKHPFVPNDEQVEKDKDDTEEEPLIKVIVLPSKTKPSIIEEKQEEYNDDDDEGKEQKEEHQDLVVKERKKVIDEKKCNKKYKNLRKSKKNKKRVAAEKITTTIKDIDSLIVSKNCKFYKRGEDYYKEEEEDLVLYQPSYDDGFMDLECKNEIIDKSSNVEEEQEQQHQKSSLSNSLPVVHRVFNSHMEPPKQPNNKMKLKNNKKSSKRKKSKVLAHFDKANDLIKHAKTRRESTISQISRKPNHDQKLLKHHCFFNVNEDFFQQKPIRKNNNNLNHHSRGQKKYALPLVKTNPIAIETLLTKTKRNGLLDPISQN